MSSEAKVTITFTYPLNLDCYPVHSVSSPEDAVRYDQEAVDTGRAKIQDLLDFNPFNIQIGIELVKDSE